MCQCVLELDDEVQVDNCVCSESYGGPDPWSCAVATGGVSTADSAEIGREIGTSSFNGIWDISGSPFPKTLGRNLSWWHCLCLPSSNNTWNETGPDVSTIFSGSHFESAPKSSGVTLYVKRTLASLELIVPSVVIFLNVKDAHKTFFLQPWILAFSHIECAWRVGNWSPWAVWHLVWQHCS